MPLGKEEIEIALRTTYDRKGIAQLEQELTKLQNKRLLGKDFRDPRNKEVAIQAALARHERARAKAQRQTLMSGLGIMFFFQNLTRTFNSLLNPAATAVGLFELFSTILELLFLPVMLALLPVMLTLLKAVASLPKEAKMGIGILAILALVVSSLIGFLAQLALLETTGVLAAGTITGLVAALGSLALPILAVVAAIIALLVYRDQIVGFFNDIKNKLNDLLSVNVFGTKIGGGDVLGSAATQIVGGPLAPLATNGDMISGIVGAIGGLLSPKVVINNSAGVTSNVSVEQGRHGSPFISGMGYTVVG